jgi:hypothetical protein
LIDALAKDFEEFGEGVIRIGSRSRRTTCGFASPCCRRSSLSQNPNWTR